jgi:hypothetical protein
MANDTTELLPPSLRGKLIGGEKVTGSVIGLGIVGAILVGLYEVGPFIIKSLVNLYAIGALSLGLVLLIGFASNRKVQSIFTLGFAIGTRRIHDQMVQRAPYDILKYVIGCMKDDVAKSQSSLGRIRGANQRLAAQIEKNDGEIQQHVSYAKAAEKSNQTARKESQLRMLGQVDTINKSLKKQLEMQVRLAGGLQKAVENGQIKVEEQENAVRVAIEAHAVSVEGKEASADILSAINGDPEKKALFDESMTVILKETAMNYGQMQQMAEDIRPMMDQIELGKVVDAERGQKLLDEYEQKVGELVLPVSAKASIASAPAAS